MEWPKWSWARVGISVTSPTTTEMGLAAHTLRTQKRETKQLLEGWQQLF